MAAMLVNPTVLGAEDDATGVPSPSWRKELSPQQRTVPSTISAQENMPPAATATAFWIPGTCTGTAESAVDVEASWPRSPAPQQRTSPLTVTAHVWSSPAEIATNGPPLVT